MRRAQNRVTYAELEKQLGATGKILCVVDDPAFRSVTLIVADVEEELPEDTEAPFVGRDVERTSVFVREWA